MADDRLRLDKWLWHARFFKTRTLSAEQVSAGRVRLNGNRVSKPAHPVAPGDVLTVAQGLYEEIPPSGPDGINSGTRSGT